MNAPIVPLDASNAKGKMTEDRFLAAFQEKGWNKPTWYRSIRRATNHEDTVDGHDFFIDTDLGEVPIQVKSSKYFIDGYFKKHPHSKALIVVVRPDFDAVCIRGITVRKIMTHRQKTSILYQGNWSIPARTFD